MEIDAEQRDMLQAGLRHAFKDYAGLRRFFNDSCEFDLNQHTHAIAGLQAAYDVVIDCALADGWLDRLLSSCATHSNPNLNGVATGLLQLFSRRTISVKFGSKPASPDEPALLTRAAPRLAYQSDSYLLGVDSADEHFVPVYFALPAADEDPVQADELLATSFDVPGASPPLCLVLPFPPDCRETLLYLYTRAVAGAPGHSNTEPRSVFWCDGADAVAILAADGASSDVQAALAAGACRNPADRAEVGRIVSAMAQWRASLLLVDLSGLDIEQMLDQPQFARALRKLYAGLGDWLKHAPSSARNRVAVALPRSFEAAGVGATLLEELWPQRVFHAADPACLVGVTRGRPRLARSASRSFDGRTLGALLDVFTHYNSNALRVAVTALLGSNGVDPNQPPRAEFLLHAANRLRIAGFLEVAYRLEVLFRHVETSRPSEPRSAELCAHPSLGIGMVAQGCVADLRALPMVHSRFVMFGTQGIGKSESLAQIEYAYAIPFRESPARSFAQWLPIRLDTGRPSDGWLARSIAGHANVVRSRQGKEPVELQAHRKLAALLKRSESRCLLGSPLLLLIDDAEEVDWSDSSPVWSADSGMLERAGTILSWGEEEAAAFASTGRLREYLKHAGGARMEGLPFSAARVLFRDLGGGADIDGVRFGMDQPIHGMLQLPALVAYLARLPAAALSEDPRLTLFEVLRRNVHGTTGPAPDLDDEIVIDDVLPAAAYKLRSGIGMPGLADDDIRRASRLGLVRNSLRLTFVDRLIGDYFVAREMQKRFVQDPQALAFDALRGAPEHWNRHHVNLVRMLCGALPREGVARLVEHLLRHGNAHLAHVGLLELTNDDYAQLPLAAAVAEQLVKEASLPDSKSARSAAAALSYRDPRIPEPGRLLEGFKEIGDGIWFGLWPVTNLEFCRFVRDGGYQRDDPARPDNLWSEAGRTWKRCQGVSEPAFWHFSDYAQPNKPVVGVSHYEATAYCAWLTEKLRADHKVGLVVDLPRPWEWDVAAGMLQRLPQLMASSRALQTYGEGATLPVDEDPQVMLEQALAAIRGQPHGVLVCPRPIGIGTIGQEGPHDLFGNVWQWCNEDLTGNGLNDTKVGQRRTAVVRGGPGADVSMMMGGGLDLNARVHMVGFRVIAVSEQIQAVRRVS